MISIKLIGINSLMRRLATARLGIAGAISAGMREAAFVVEREGKLAITSGPNRAIKTGYLRSSIGVTSVLPYRATVTAGAFYGIYVHEGTRYMRKRPFLHAGLKKAVPQIERILGRRIKALIET